MIEFIQFQNNQIGQLANRLTILQNQHLNDRIIWKKELDDALKQSNYWMNQLQLHSKTKKTNMTDHSNEIKQLKIHIDNMIRSENKEIATLNITIRTLQSQIDEMVSLLKELRKEHKILYENALGLGQRRKIHLTWESKTYFETKIDTILNKFNKGSRA